MRTLYTVMDAKTPVVVATILGVCLPDAQTVLDATYGKGGFWRGGLAPVTVTGCDLNPDRARDQVADFTSLPFADGSFDVVVFDPPFLSDTGKGSVMGARYGSYTNLASLKLAILQGVRECWRVSRLGMLFKGQDYIHASRMVFMSRWPEEELGLPFQIVHQLRHKLVDPKWKAQLSAYSNSSTYVVWRKDGPVHKRRSLK